MTYEDALQYAKGGLEVYQRDYPELTTQIEFQKLGIKALEKQIAKKPIVDEWERVKCANGHNIPVLSRNHNMPYCPFCGQHIDWRDYE